MTPDPAQLVVSGLTRAFATGARVLDGVDLTLPGGQITALLGPSGAGKTSLARCIAGLDEPQGGRISLGIGDTAVTLNDPAARVAAQHRRVGMVFQGLALWSHRRVVAHLSAVLAARKVPRAQRPQRIADLLQLAGLTGKDRRYPHQLSGGEQQRLAIARALAGDPALLILDEPLTGFEEAVREPVRAEWRRLAADGLTTLLITHDRREALALGHQLAVLNAGRIDQCAPPDDVLNRPATAFVARFVGDCNLLPVRLPVDGGDAVDSTLGTLHVQHGGRGGVVGGAGAFLQAAIRPAALVVSPSTDESAGTPATVLRREPTLDGQRLHLQLANGQSLIAAATHPLPSADNTCRVRVIGSVWLVS